MILSLNVGYSQDTTIELEYRIARLVIADLVEGDQVKEELFLNEQQLAILQSKILLKDNVIFKKDEIIKNYEEIIGTRSEQLKLSKDLSTQLQGDLKKQKAKTKLFQLGGASVVVGALVLSIL